MLRPSAETLRSLARLSDHPDFLRVVEWITISLDDALTVALHPNTERRDFDAGRSWELRTMLRDIRSAREEMLKL